MVNDAMVNDAMVNDAMVRDVSVVSTADAYLELLHARGIGFLFGNGGTDFGPVIDAYAKRNAKGEPAPVPVTVPHEIVAVAMAHGHAMVTGHPQAVMVHTVAGTANSIGGLINAARAQVPDAVQRGPHPAHRGPVARFARSAHPLGAGIVRSGFHGARVGEVGLRAAPRCRPRGRGRSRPGHHHQRAARARST